MFDKRKDAPAGRDGGLADALAALARIEAKLDRLLGETPPAPGAETLEQRNARFAALGKQLKAEGETNAAAR